VDGLSDSVLGDCATPLFVIRSAAARRIDIRESSKHERWNCVRRGIPGRQQIDRSAMVRAPAKIVKAMSVPVSADAEGGYGRVRTLR